MEDQQFALVAPTRLSSPGDSLTESRPEVTKSSVVSQPEPALFCREAVFADHEKISALEIRNGLQAKPRAEWELLWTNNPTYRCLPRWQIGWVAETRDNQITAYFGNVPLSYEFQGEPITVATGRAMVADPEYRGSAASLFHRFVRQPGADLIIDSSCNLHSAPIHEALRFSRVPVGAWDRSSFWVTDYSGFALSTLRKRGLPKWLRYVMQPALKMRQPPSRELPRITRELETSSSFDDRFDEFWLELREARRHQLVANRSREVLAWHFRNALTSNRAWIVTASQGSRLVAYSVFLRQDNPAFGLTRIRLVDFQALQGGADALESMLAWGVKHCQDQRIHMLEAFGFAPEKQTVIDRLAPFRRRFPSWLYYIKTLDKAFAEKLADPAVWDPCLFDGDITL